MATTDEKCADGSRFGNRALLDKFDKLRELGVSADTPLPQVSEFLHISEDSCED